MQFIWNESFHLARLEFCIRRRLFLLDSTKLVWLHHGYLITVCRLLTWHFLSANAYVWFLVRFRVIFFCDTDMFHRNGLLETCAGPCMHMQRSFTPHSAHLICKHINLRRILCSNVHRVNYVMINRHSYMMRYHENPYVDSGKLSVAIAALCYFWTECDSIKSPPQRYIGRCMRFLVLVVTPFRHFHLFATHPTGHICILASAAAETKVSKLSCGIHILIVRGNHISQHDPALIRLS